MNAIIIAGGKGERLGKLTEKMPKPLLIIGNKPIIEHQILLLKKFGFSEVIICTNYLSNMIENYLGNGKKWNICIYYSVEEKPLGTAGCVKKLETILKEDFLIFYGDIMVNMNLKLLEDYHFSKKSAATLVVHSNSHPLDSDLININKDNKVISFFPKPHKDGLIFKNLVNAGVYILSNRIFKYINDGEKSDFGKDIFPEMLKSGEDIYAYNSPEYLKDTGTVNRLAEVRKDWKSLKIFKENLSLKRPAIFLDRDGVINKEVGLLYDLEQMELMPGAAEAIRKINKTEYLTVVISNQSVVARGLCDLDDVEKINNKLETLLGFKGAKLDKIYYCPHHTDKGYPEENPIFKVACICRKPNTGMIDSAEKELNIDLSNSFLIGDQTLDIMTAKNGGLISIGVRSGLGCKDGNYKKLPDIWADNLQDAIDKILNLKKYTFYFNFLLDKINLSSKLKYIIAIESLKFSNKDIFSLFLIRFLENKSLKCSISKKRDLKIKNNNVEDYSDCLKEVMIINDDEVINFEASDKLVDLKIFINTDEKDYKKRFYNFYRWQGLPMKDINILYKIIKENEVPKILKKGEKADLIIQ